MAAPIRVYGKVVRGSALFGAAFGITDSIRLLLSDPILMSFRERIGYCALEVLILFLAGLFIGILVTSLLILWRKFTVRDPAPVSIYALSFSILALATLLVCDISLVLSIAYALSLLLIIRFFPRKIQDPSSPQFRLLYVTLPILIRVSVAIRGRYNPLGGNVLFLAALAAISLILLSAVSILGEGLRKRSRTFCRGIIPLVVLFGLLAILVFSTLLLPTLKPSSMRELQYPNLLFILVDALRKDRLGAYGYTKNVSPTIDRLAQEGAFFTTVVSTAPQTRTSMPSIMTSQPPSVHGVDMSGEFEKALPTNIETLAGMLAGRGYRTAAFVANPWIKVTGLDRGFQEFSDSGILRKLIMTHSRFYLLCLTIWRRLNNESMYPIAGRLNRQVITWLRKRSSEPFFLFIHYMDVHNPYIPPPEFCGDLEDVTARYFDAWNAIEGGEVEKRKERLDFLKQLYDCEIRYFDSSLRDVLNTLDELGLSENTLIVLTSDHGEEFLEHGRLGHYQALYDEVLLVPLIFNLTGRAKGIGAIERQCTTLDILPTILSILGVPVPDSLGGLSLYPFEPGLNNLPDGRTLYSESRDYVSARTANWKLIRSKTDSSEELYNLEDDPMETRSVLEDNPGIANKLRRGIADYLEQKNRIGLTPLPAEVTDETRKRLRSLGYIVK